MKYFFLICIFLSVFVKEIICTYVRDYKYQPGGGAFENPNFIKDRPENVIKKPEMPDAWSNRYKQRYHPAWMDYCAPYHCNDYHKTVCGLHRSTRTFKWFQSGCHLILNNQCASYRGLLTYDIVDTKFCATYVMFKRQSCQKLKDCPEDSNPVCGKSTIDAHVVLFENKCAMDVRNCNTNYVVDEYQEVPMDICNVFIKFVRSSLLLK